MLRQRRVTNSGRFELMLPQIRIDKEAIQRVSDDSHSVKYAYWHVLYQYVLTIYSTYLNILNYD